MDYDQVSDEFNNQLRTLIQKMREAGTPEREIQKHIIDILTEHVEPSGNSYYNNSGDVEVERTSMPEDHLGWHSARHTPEEIEELLRGGEGRGWADIPESDRPAGWGESIEETPEGPKYHRIIDPDLVEADKEEKETNLLNTPMPTQGFRETKRIIAEELPSGFRQWRCPACDGWLSLDRDGDWRCNECNSAWADTGDGPDIDNNEELEDWPETQHPLGPHTGAEEGGQELYTSGRFVNLAKWPSNPIWGVEVSPAAGQRDPMPGDLATVQQKSKSFNRPVPVTLVDDMGGAWTFKNGHHSS